MRTTKPDGENLVATKDNTYQYSFIPQSIWHISSHNGLKEYKELVSDEFYNPGLRKKGKGASGVGRKYKYSEFSPLLARQILEYWSDENDLVIDPFAGRGTRVLMAKSMNRRSIACDISWEFASHVKEKSSKMGTLEDFDDSRYIYIPEVVHCDSTNIPLKDNVADFVYSCPPYWCIEKYESRNGQLSDIDDYKVFLSKLKDVFKECYRVLKDGKFIVIVVQDFRLWRKFYAFGSHTSVLLEEAGFNLYDTVIRTYTTNVAAKMPDAKAQKYNVKMHEYIIVARKVVNAELIWNIIKK
jgi:DNA modification methylase